MLPNRFTETLENHGTLTLLRTCNHDSREAQERNTGDITYCAHPARPGQPITDCLPAHDSVSVTTTRMQPSSNFLPGTRNSLTVTYPKMSGDAPHAEDCLHRATRIIIVLGMWIAVFGSLPFSVFATKNHVLDQEANRLHPARANLTSWRNRCNLRHFPRCHDPYFL